MNFDWDNNKNQSNFRKHGVWFEEAKMIWADAGSLEFSDPEHSLKEDRFIRIGHSQGNRLLLVVFCEKLGGRVIRIISARRATKRERSQYEEGI